MDLNELLRYTVEQNASDLHLKVGLVPHVRVDGELRATSYAEITREELEALILSVIPYERSEDYRKNYEADFGITAGALGRFRVNAFRQRGLPSMVLRRLPKNVPTFKSLGLPIVAQRLADEPNGLILVTGPTGSGKTTTTAAMIDYINKSRSAHIITIEDPIEVLHEDQKSLVSQREVGIDTKSFAEALRRALRQDPDVIFIGEIRDEETVQVALSAAETGHLVISTLHTINASETINRIIDFFPLDKQRQVRTTLAGTLRGVLSQRLLARTDGLGRIPATETLVVNGRVLERIIGDETIDGIEEIMREGEYYGMHTFDQSLFELVRDGVITERDAFTVATNAHDLSVELRQAGVTADV